MLNFIDTNTTGQYDKKKLYDALNINCLELF